MFDLALGIFLFLSPIINLFGNNARLNGQVLALQFYQFRSLSPVNSAVQLQFFLYGIIVLFAVALMSKTARSFKDKYLAYFLGLCGMSVILHPKTLSAFTPILLGCLFYYLVVTYVRNIRRLSWVIVAVATLNTIFAVMQFFNVHLLYQATGRIDGLMCLSTHLGQYQAVATPFFYAIHPLLIIIPVIGLILSKSFTPLIALFIGMAYLWYPKKGKFFVNLAPMGLIALLGVIIAFVVRNHQLILYKGGLRVDLWFHSVKQLMAHPFLGHGVGTFSRNVPGMGQWNWTYNEYLGVAFYLGITGLFIALMFLKDKFLNVGDGFKRIVAASCLIVVIICLGQPMLHFPRMVGTVIPLFAFLKILKRKEIPNEDTIYGGT